MDSERAKELKHSILWKEFCSVLEDDITKCKEQLVYATDSERVSRLQERIRVVREIIKKPDAIIDQSASG